MSDLEIEVKFFLPDPAPIRGRLRALGAEPESEPVFERNLRFENAAGDLRRRRALLRLRRDRSARLTYKGPPGAAGAELAGAVKVFRELEVSVSDFEGTRAILEAVGFSVVQSYEKWRQTFAIDGAECCVDILPFGAFLEIEGPPETIRSVSRRLELPWRRRILANYLALFDAVRDARGLPFSDLAFAHFEGRSVDAAAVIRGFEAGDGP
jgi:adenylate cyclase class 2